VTVDDDIPKLNWQDVCIRQMSPLNPKVWGASLWAALHFVALGYPESPSEDDVAAYRAFFSALDKVIPCGSCSDNYRRHLTELSIEPYLISGGEGRLFEWTVLLHNLVNKELEKPRSDWTPEEARAELLAPFLASVATPPPSSVPPYSSSSSQMPHAGQHMGQHTDYTGGHPSTAASIFAVLAVLVALLTFAAAAWLVLRRIHS
jgi:hypothetical protein